MHQEELWCAFIERWLDETIPAAQYQSRPSWSDPSRRGDSSPTKKRKIAGDPFYDSAGLNKDTETLSEDLQYDGAVLERTPRPHVSPTRSQAQERDLTLRPFNLPSLPPGRSAASSPSRPSATSTNTSKQRRSVSPVKTTRALQLLEKPVKFVALEDNATKQLPDDVGELYSRIYSITDLREDFLPSEVRGEIFDLVGSLSVPERWFRRPGQHENKSKGEVQEGNMQEGNDTQKETQESGSQDLLWRKPTTPRAIAIAELDALLDIKNIADECLRLGHSEASWNLEVHGPLLKLAVSQHRCVRRELLTTASISSPFVPAMRARGGDDFAASKMVDFALWLAISRTDPLAAAIRDAVNALPYNMRGVNQTIYGPVRYAPIATSIETKTVGTAEEGRVQLGVWTAAWHKRFEAFLAARGGSVKWTIVTLPLLLIVENEWKLFFACDRGASIVSI